MASGVGDKFKNIDWKDVGEKAKQVGFFVMWEVRKIVERIRTHENFSKKAAGSSVLLSFALGITFGLGLALYWLSPIYDLGLFLVFWSFFHLFEWIFVAITSPKELSADSFLINHSLEFTIAIGASFVEYFIELLVFPSMKGTLLLYVGLLVTASGQLLRTISQFHAGASFTHQVQETKRDEHVLVQSGPYRYIRHPGYLGWYWWAVGTQVLLFNPICIVGYAFYAWKFFKERIEYEEEYLTTMFGKDYTEYRARTPTYLPLIS